MDATTAQLADGHYGPALGHDAECVAYVIDAETDNLAADHTPASIAAAERDGSFYVEVDRRVRESLGDMCRCGDEN